MTDCTLHLVLIHIVSQLSESILIMQALSVPKPPERIVAPGYDVEMLVANIVQHFFEMQDRTGVSASHNTALLPIFIPD